MKKRLWVAYFAFFLCWGINSYMLVYKLFNDHELFARVMGGRPYISDFVNHYTAGVLGQRAQREHINIYDVDVQTKESAKVIAPIVAEMPFYLQYPPTLFVFCIPFAFLPPNYAWLTWSVLGFVSVLASVYALFHTESKTRFALAFAIVAVLGSFPMWLSIELGQTSLFLFAALSAFWILLKEERPFAAGLASLFLLVKVQYLPFIVACGIAIGRVRYAAGFLIASAVAAAVCIAILGWDNCIEWPKVLLHAETNRRFSGVEPQGQQNIRGILFWVMGGDTHLVGTIVATLCILSAGALGFLWWKVKPNLANTSRWSFNVCAALSTMAMLLFSVHTHSQDYLLFTLPCLWLWVATDEFVDGTNTGQESDQNLEQEGPKNAERKKKLALTIRRMILLYPFVSWIFFLLRLVPFTTMVQWFACYLIMLALCAFRLWFSKNK